MMGAKSDAVTVNFHGAADSILGACMESPPAAVAAVELIQAEEMPPGRHRVAFLEIVKIIHSGGAVDLITVCVACAGKVESAWLSGLTGGPAGPAHVQQWAGIIKECSRRLRMAEAGRRLTTGALDPLQNPQFLTEQHFEALGAGGQVEGKARLSLKTPLDLACLMERTPPAVSFFVRDKMPLARGVLITGLGGSSKTRLIYHLALGGVLGRLPFDWQVERTGKAFLLLTEDVPEDVHRILHSMTRGLGLTPDEKAVVADNLIIHPLAGQDVKLLVKTPAGVLEKSPLFSEVTETIKALGDVVFVGIDPALGVTEGDELDQNHQRSLGKMADDLAIATGATVALVSHATKGSLGQDELTSHSSRGGGAITDAVRAEYVLRNMTAKEATKAGICDLEERRRYVQLSATKGNTLPPTAFVPIWLRRDDTGCLLGSDLQSGADVNGGAEDTLFPAKMKAAMEVLQGLCAEHRRNLESAGHDPAGGKVTKSDWRAAVVEKGLYKRQSSYRMVTTAIERGLVEADELYVYPKLSHLSHLSQETPK